MLYVDGTQVATGTGGSNSQTAPPQLYLGAVPSGGGFLNGDIAEVIIFNSVIANTTRVAYEYALKGKYGLSPGEAPATPAGLTGTAGNRQIALDWAPAIGASSYNLFRSTNNGATFQQIATGLAIASYVDASALNGQTNFYEVMAVNSLAASTNSAPVGIFLPEPVLGVSASTSSLTFTWPGWAAGWVLNSTTNLTPPVGWFPVTNTVDSSNGEFIVTIPIDSAIRFFRLSAP